MAAASSGGSDAFFGLALLVIIASTLLLLRHYLPLRTTPAYLLVPVFLALALPASVLLLVPIDLASSAVPEDGSHRGIWLPKGALLVCWRISYWLTFCLTWFVLPLLGQFSDSGHREPRERLMYSLRTNLRYYLMMLALSVGGLAYFFVSSGAEVTSFKAMVIALAYAWGLILAIYLMGHGLVAIPRRLYRNASTSGRLRRLQAQAPRVHERLLDAVESLEALEAQVLQLRQRKTGTARDFREWIDELVDSSDMPSARITSSTSAQLPAGTIPAVITERYLADLTRKLKRARHRRIRFVEEWASLALQAKHLQTVLDSSSSHSLTFDTTASPNRYNPLSPRTRYYLHAILLPYSNLLLSGLTTLASLSILWTELFSRLFPKLSLIALTIIHHPTSADSKIGFTGQLIAVLWLCYMVLAALTSISEVRLWGNRALVRRHTYAESACWYAALVARLTVPLSYNFCTFVPAEIFENTAFYAFLGRLINLTPLGTGFSYFFPLFVLVPVLMTGFGFYGRVKSWTGFGGMEEDEEFDNAGGIGAWREGKALIDRDIRGSDSLGLASREHSPRPPATRPGALLPSYRDEPALAPTTASAGTSSLHPPAPHEQRTRRLGVGAVQDEDDTETNFFSEFTHRLRNTIDTAEKPDWVPSFEFKRPKWMGGDNDGGGAGENGLRNLFGGGYRRGRESRVML